MDLMPPIKLVDMTCLTHTSIAYNGNKIGNQSMDIKRKIISYVAKEHPAASWSHCLLAGDMFFKFLLVATNCVACGSFKIY